MGDEICVFLHNVLEVNMCLMLKVIIHVLSIVKYYT